MNIAGFYLSRSLILRAYSHAREKGIPVSRLADKIDASVPTLMTLLARSHAPKRRDSAIERLRSVASRLARETGYKGEMLERVEFRPTSV